jgi:predicted permease
MLERFPRIRRAFPFLSKPEIEVDDELAFHLEHRVNDYIKRGMDPTTARAAALERFGDVNSVRRDCTDLLEAERRDERRRDWLGDLQQDLRFGVRSSLRTPLFTLLAVFTLALGIGANAAVFSIVKSVLLDALPYADAGRVVRIYAKFRERPDDRAPLSAGTITDVAKRQRAFTSVAYFMHFPEDVAYIGSDGPHPMTAARIGSGFFTTLGVSAARGRLLTDDDAAPGAPLTTVLSYETWQRTFGGDPRIVGKKIQINTAPRVVVGVLPRGFVGPMGNADLWVSLDVTPVLQDPIGARRRHWLGAVARLAPGATMTMAAQDLSRISAELAREFSDEADHTVFPVALRDTLVGDTRTPLLVVMASAALVLLITCANLAGAILSRTISRRKEFAVRIALGAGRARLVRQLLTESTLLALIGGAAGIALAFGGLAFARTVASSALPSFADISMDRGALVFTSLVALVTGLGFGLAPALSVARSNPQATLRDETRGSSETHRTRRLRGMLVAGQIALCVSLVAGAGLLVRSLWALTNAPLGFDPDHVLTVSVQLPPRRYAESDARLQLYDQLEQRLRALPGVSGVASTSQLPSASMDRNGLAIEGGTWRDNAVPFVLYASISDDYFRTMGMSLRSGRTFNNTDGPGRTETFVISEATARRYWPKGNAIGAHIRLGPNQNLPWGEIVGIVADVRNDPAQANPEPIIYASMRRDNYFTRTFVVRTNGDPLALIKPFQNALWSLDKNLPLRHAMPLKAVLAEALANRRLPVALMSAFSALALLLASVGVYALFASMTAAREREFGVRLALGSSPGEIAALVLRQGGVWMAAGLGAGAVGVVIVGRAVRGLLYGVTPLDPIAMTAAAAILIACGVAALLVPVRRAARVDPITILR